MRDCGETAVSGAVVAGCVAAPAFASSGEDSAGRFRRRAVPIVIRPVSMQASPTRAQMIMPVLAMTAEKENAETDVTESKKFPQELSGANDTGTLSRTILAGLSPCG